MIFDEQGAPTDAPKRLLLVEDDTFLREILSEKLVRVGYEVTALKDSDRVLETAIEKMPHLVLLDIVMPNKNGYEVIEELKGDAKTKDIPILVLSNLGQEEDIEKAKKLGAYDFLTKANFMPTEIIEKIESVLQEHAVNSDEGKTKA